VTTSKFTAKLYYVNVNVVVICHKILWWVCFMCPRLLHLRVKCPPPFSYAMAWKASVVMLASLSGQSLFLCDIWQLW